MKISLKTVSLEEQQKSCLIIGMFEDGEYTKAGKNIDQLIAGYLKKLGTKGCFQGKIGQTLPLFFVTGSPFEHILLVGCGKSKPLSAASFSKIVTAAMKALNNSPSKSAISFLAELDVKQQSLPWKVKQIVEASIQTQYRFDLFKSEKEPSIALKELIIYIPHAKEIKACEQALKQGQAVASGMKLAKNLANLPSNICTPQFLAMQAKELAKEEKTISVNILEEKEMEKLGMGALLAVSQGSALDAKLICLHYKGTSQKKAPIVLVGKGITFDTGGNSLKSPEQMVGMKYDMCGAATVLGTLKAAALLKLPLNVVGVIPAAENMPGGTAYKPEDIITSLSGQTIEVISTDAEGRLILADALTYCERYKPDVVIDIATLTGAVVVALGFQATGLLANQDKLAADLLKAGEESNDRAWQFPLWDEYQEQLKSPFADMTNSGGRFAGVITAGCFLSRFAKKFDWAHLDVAGTAATMIGTNDRMATGRPVPLLMQYLINRALA